MPLDPSSIESELSSLRAAALDDVLLERLDACANGNWTELTPAETAMEHSLRAITPAGLPPSLLASLEAITASAPFPREDIKIVPFPERDKAAPRKHRTWWSAAAAVAICGALSALLVPHQQERKPVAARGAETHSLAVANNSDKLIPAGFNRGLSEASDEGVVWNSNKQPHRVLKVVYQDRVTLKDSAGRTYQVEQPRVEYILVPANAD